MKYSNEALFISGEWIQICVHIGKQFGYSDTVTNSSNATFNWSEISLESLRLQKLPYFLFLANLISYIIYFTIGGFLHVSI